MAASALATTGLTALVTSSTQALDTIPNQGLGTNMGFESDLTGWTKSTNALLATTTSGVHTGAKSGLTDITGTGTKSIWVESPKVDNTWDNIPYNINVNLKATSTGGNFVIEVRETNAAGTLVGSNSVTKAVTDTFWKKPWVDYTTVGQNTKLSIRVTLQNSTPTRDMMLDNAGISIKQRFFGDPGRGNVYYGASSKGLKGSPDNNGAMVPDGFEATLGKRYSVHRTFFNNKPPAPAAEGNFKDAEVQNMVDQIVEDWSKDRLPHVSIKAANWAQVASPPAPPAGQDTELDAVLKKIAAQGTTQPVILTIHHEPEDDNGSANNGTTDTTADDYVTGSPADFVAMQNTAIARAAALAPNVTVVPVLMSKKFVDTNDPMYGIETQWVVPNAAVFGIDIYNPGSSPAVPNTWTTIAARIDGVKARLASAGLGAVASKPIVIGEYGVKPLAATSDDATWVTNSLSEARARNVVAMSYFNSGQGVNDSWEFTNDDRQAAFTSILNASPWVFRIANIL